MSALLDDIDALAARIPDGAKVALPPDYSGCAMAAVRALIKRGVRDLHLIGVPSVGFQGDMLIGAGCVATLETAAVTIGEYGLAPCFTRAIKAGTIKMIDGTCPAIHAGLQAAEKGIPFMPVRGIVGSDLLEQRDDWMVGNDPFGDDQGPLVLVKAICDPDPCPAGRPPWQCLDRRAPRDDGDGPCGEDHAGDLRQTL
jgi:glutaconate CoA-transferase subunit A